jgi:hypothetical protein
MLSHTSLSPPQPASLTLPQPEDDSEDDVFSCQLGFFGQVILKQKHSDGVSLVLLSITYILFLNNDDQ